MRFIIIFFLLCSVAWAEPQSTVYHRPNIPQDKILNIQERQQVKDALTKGKKRIFKYLTPAKNDYQNAFDRGTVEFTTTIRKDGTPLNKNYSFHKLEVANGTIIKNCNLSQNKPFTKITIAKNLTFVHCNLVNVLIDPGWILIDCNNIHIRKVLLEQVNKGEFTTLRVSHQLWDDSKFVEQEIDEEDIPNYNLSDALLEYQ